MQEKYGKKKQSMMKVLVAGLFILGLSLGVCFWFVMSLEKTYREEVSEDFHSRHYSCGEILDGSIDYIVELVEAAAETMGDEAYAYNSVRVHEVLQEFGYHERIDTFSFISNTGDVYYDGNRYDKSRVGFLWDELWAELDQITGTYVAISQSEYEDGAEHILIASPMEYGGFVKGYIVATVSLKNVFTDRAYNYLNEMGECYILDQEGNILARSEDATIIDKEHTDFFMGTFNYSDGKEDARLLLETMRQNMQESMEGHISIKTAKQETMQICFYPVQNMEGIYFVSMYNDNLVDDNIQPLVFRSVLSCITIITLLIATIIFVWATAKKANITIEKLAYEDPVTKGKNINFFKEFAMNIMSAFREHPFVIYRFDIANFRYINEAYGHKRADEVLVSCIKNFDEIFSDKELCVRMNADQFLAIIVNDNSVDQRLMQFKKKVNEDARGKGVKYPIRFKTGIYQVRKNEKDIDVMIDHANVARKTLNGDEKEMTAVYSEQIVTDMRKVDRIETDMQRALATGEFKVYMQPKCDIFKNQVAGAEALVRWIKPDGSMVMPNIFIPVFENNGFIEKLDFYMLEMVCQQMRELIDQGKMVYPVSVNQSRILLHNPDYVNNIKKIIKTYNIPQNYIELEITETVFLDERVKMIETMKQLKECGVRLAMDDFGSGFSSLNMLKDIPFDIIKIDREFFSESVTSASSKVVLQKIMEMAEGLGIEVVCEGVETEEQIKMLQQMGCRMVQGFFYSRPIPNEEYVERYC